MSYYNSTPKYKRVLCECGCVVDKGYLKQHKRTKQHIKLLNEKQPLTNR